MNAEKDWCGLRGNIKSFAKIYRRRHGQNFWWNGVLVVTGILLSAGIAVAGLFGEPHAAALFGIGSTALFALHGAFAIGERAEFQRIVALEAEILYQEALCGPFTAEKFVEVRDRYQSLRRHADKTLPRGSGMEAVRQMYQSNAPAR